MIGRSRLVLLAVRTETGKEAGLIRLVCRADVCSEAEADHGAGTGSNPVEVVQSSLLWCSISDVRQARGRFPT